MERKTISLKGQRGDLDNLILGFSIGESMKDPELEQLTFISNAFDFPFLFPAMIEEALFRLKEPEAQSFLNRHLRKSRLKEIVLLYKDEVGVERRIIARMIE